MSDDARAARNAYKRKWAQENPDKVREHQKRYWEKKARQAAENAKDDIPQEAGA